MRIGFIGSSFRCHSVGWLIRHAIAHLNRQGEELFFYAFDCRKSDFLQDFFKTQGKFKDCDHAPLDKIVAAIKRDNLDVLIELDGVTSDRTLSVLAYRPCKRQGSWLGFDCPPAPWIDFVIADDWVLPENPPHYPQVLRMPHCYVAIDGFDVGVPSLSRKRLGIPEGTTVFLNCQKPIKNNAIVIEAQLTILQRSSNAVLLVKQFGSGQYQREWMKISTGIGVDKRLKFIAPELAEETARANMAIADVFLDSFPFNATTTALEALWLGLPVLTLVGDQFAARQGYTLLKNCGAAPQLATHTAEEYISVGCAIADGGLKELRQQIRDSRHTSALWDAEQFAKDLAERLRSLQ